MSKKYFFMYAAFASGACYAHGLRTKHAAVAMYNRAATFRGPDKIGVSLRRLTECEARLTLGEKFNPVVIKLYD